MGNILAILPLEVSLVEKYIDSEEFKAFSKEVAKSLNVDDLFSTVEYQRTFEKYPYKQCSLAFTIFSPNYKSFQGVYFNTKKIASETDTLYQKYIDLEKEYILKVLVDFLLIHELTHVSQFKNKDFKMYTYNPSSNSRDYKNSDFEVKANDTAYDYLKDKSSHTKKVLDIILEIFYK